MARSGTKADYWRLRAKAADWDAKKLAAMCQISSRQLRRQFRKELSCSPQEWLDDLRMREAELMLACNKQVKEVAVDLRFKNLPHFCRAFKADHRLTPSVFRALGESGGSRI